MCEREPPRVRRNRQRNVKPRSAFFPKRRSPIFFEKQSTEHTRTLELKVQKLPHFVCRFCVRRHSMRTSRNPFSAVKCVGVLSTTGCAVNFSPTIMASVRKNDHKASEAAVSASRVVYRLQGMVCRGPHGKKCPQKQLGRTEQFTGRVVALFVLSRVHLFISAGVHFFLHTAGRHPRHTHCTPAHREFAIC